MRAYLRTFGCRANQYDTERVRAMIVASGGTIVDTPAEADVSIFNSCTVTTSAEADLRQAVRRAALSHGTSGAGRSIVMGCAAALDTGVIAALPNVSAVIAGDDLAAVAHALGIEPGSFVAAPGTQSGARALLRIQDGCDEHCTFCATTVARGASRSRAVDQLIFEAQRLGEHHPEIVLTGVHIGTYGADIGSSLGALVDRLVREVPGPRLRLTSVEATEVDSLLAEHLTAPDSSVVPHLHAPLQSGSDRVLRRMGRHWYTAATYRHGISRLVGRSNRFALGADIISGFPGGTDADHEATVRLVADLPFTYLHVFPWSARPGVAAARLKGRVAPEVARRRAVELRVLAEEKAGAYRRARCGGSADVVVVGDGPRRTGLTEDYLSVALAEQHHARRTRFAATLRAGAGTDLVAVRIPSP